MLTQETKRIESIVRSHLTGFAEGFKKRHIDDVDNTEGAINLKKQNVFMSALPNELVYYSAFVRSFDSSFGGLLEKMALEIARENFEVSKEVCGQISTRQHDHINDILNGYRKRETKPQISHYDSYNVETFSLIDERKDSDYVFYDKDTDTYHIVELKAGGDLDSKKAPAEKRELLIQYFLLKNTTKANIKLYFATAYNKFGEGNTWLQANVQRYFSQDELLIGKDFWNFVCKSEQGFDSVIKAYNENVYILIEALNEIREAYLI